MSTKYSSDYKPTDPFPYEVRPNLYESVFSPDGLVPYPCTHGLPALPVGHLTIAHEPRRNAAGEELPAFAGRSWGRSCHLRIVYFGGRTEHLPGGQEVTVPAATVKCVRCIDPNDQTDVTEPANGR